MGADPESQGRGASSSDDGASPAHAAGARDARAHSPGDDPSHSEIRTAPPREEARTIEPPARGNAAPPVPKPPTAPARAAAVPKPAKPLPTRTPGPKPPPGAKVPPTREKPGNTAPAPAVKSPAPATPTAEARAPTTAEPKPGSQESAPASAAPSAKNDSGAPVSDAPADAVSAAEQARARADEALRRRQSESTQEVRLRTTPSLPPSAERDAEPFARFGRFDLLGRVATGGMAEILLARESMEGATGSRHVIIKAIRGEYAEDGDFAEMFLNEGRLAMRLTHPNICMVYECGRHAGRFFIAMEYVHGQTLRDVLVRATRGELRLPIPVLLRIFALVAEALDFAHRARDSQGRKLSIVHRDVSPHNIMIRYDGVVKLLDFGVAKAEHSQHSTQSGALKGKFSYMSPEQAMGNPIDGRADVFSLGVCMFEAITGRRLFHRKAQYDTLKAILESEPPPLCAFRDDVPDRLEEIVARALAKTPEDRYQRAADLQREIEELLTDMREVASTARIAELMEEIFGEEARRPPALEVDDELRERYAPRAEPTAATLPPPPDRSKLPLVLGIAVAAVAITGAGAWVGLSGSSSTETPPAVHAHEPVPAADPPEAQVDPEPTDREPEVVATPEPSAAARDDGTLPAARDPELSQHESSVPDPEPTEEASPASERTRRSTSRTRTRDRRRTVIVTDPGF